MLPNLNGGDDKSKRVAIYCRVSGEEQTEAGTIQNQIHSIEGYVKYREMSIHDWYLDDGVSGTIPMAERLQGRRLMEDAKAGKFNVVLVYKLDRFARRLIVLLDGFNALDAMNVGLRSISEDFNATTSIGRLFMQMMGSFAEYERETIMERTSMGKARAAREGRWLGGAAPHGYCVVDKRLEIDPAEAEVVKRIFRQYVQEDKGLVPVMESLNAEEVPTMYNRRNLGSKDRPQGPPRWAVGTLSKMLHNTVYVGRYEVGKRTNKAGKVIVTYEPPSIIDQATFDEAQRLLKVRTMESNRNSRRFNPIRGLIRCHCGRVIVGDGGHAHGRSYYRCPNKGHFGQRVEVLESKVWNDVRRYVRNPEILNGSTREWMRQRMGEAEDAGRRLVEVEGQIAQNASERNRLAIMLMKEQIKEGEFDSLRLALDDELKGLERRREELTNHHEIVQTWETALARAENVMPQIWERVKRIDRDLASQDPEVVKAARREQRDVLLSLIEGGKVDEKGNLILTYWIEPVSGSFAHES